MPKLDAKYVARAKAPEHGRKIYWDDNLKGFGLLMMASGHKSFVFQYRVAKKLRRMTLQAGDVDMARTQAEVIKGQVATGRLLNKPVDPLAERRRTENIESGKGTLKAVATEWFNRKAKQHRSGTHRFNELKRLAFPTLGHRQISEIKRTEITRLLDKIEDENGPGMADYILAAMRRVMSWHEGRGDDFTSPIRRGMARTSATKRQRQRIVTDDELRAVSRAAKADSGPYGAIIRFLLLTAARREEAAQMRRSELAGDVWTIPADRYKTGVDHVIPLSPAAMAIVNELPKLGKGDLVFTAGGRVPLCSFTYRKALFDKTCGVTGWTLHDLRRTARSLLPRAGVDADIAERCLGHIIGGVRGVYDRYEYLDEKREAFEKLAKLIGAILAPPADNVVPLRSGTDGAA
jgi:integrase